ncbi:uncharacterized protein LOC133925501 [Phragmites australis]|uniref:uncharacterized protein LOC133925501 n=1 Tax=Phragmites australis TaxID=29695 RepID=UPI002D793C52|nr:uncharacterized protein LOC133925501 [Phragmites australis]
MFVPKSFGKQQEPDEKLAPLFAFSSATGRWSRQLFEPGRCAPARLYDKVMRRRRQSSEVDPWVRTWRLAVHSHGSLYAHCEKHVLVVLRCSEGTYDMVRPPADADANDGAHYAAEHVLSHLPVDSYLPEHRGRGAAAVRERRRVPRQGVGVTRIDRRGQLGWTLTHDKDLSAYARMLDLLHDAPSNCVQLATEGRGGGQGKCVWFSDEDGDDVANGGKGDGCPGRWNWDDASLLDVEVGEGELLGGAACSPPPFSFLGCHPSKEVIYLAAGAFHVVAYHLGSAKVQYLGRVMSLGDGDRVEGVFPYRPCIVDALPPYSCPFPCVKIANKASLIGQRGAATRDSGQPSEKYVPPRSVRARLVAV